MDYASTTGYLSFQIIANYNQLVVFESNKNSKVAVQYPQAIISTSGLQVNSTYRLTILATSTIGSEVSGCTLKLNINMIASNDTNIYPTGVPIEASNYVNWDNITNANTLVNISR